ncbi:hypothetical protein DFH08DRAFT_396173 [Mycena albidolilacea]|uniref:Uncharacterized protein n=1 Tax=Mycena albidolilacea TaxID=1033008 RepID=A0AAD6ZE79_9AGAR|nr:hypothetical protein DFH08DRAFT_396173 [Mycena albidolilacea]
MGPLAIDRDGSSMSAITMNCPSTGTSREGGQSTGVQDVREETGRVSIRVVLSHQSSLRQRGAHGHRALPTTLARTRCPCSPHVSPYNSARPLAPPAPVSRGGSGALTFPASQHRLRHRHRFPQPKQDLGSDSGDHRPVALDTAPRAHDHGHGHRARSARICASGSASSSFRTRLHLAHLTIEAADPSHSKPRACASPPVHARGAVCVSFFGRSTCARVLVRSSSSYIDSTVARIPAAHHAPHSDSDKARQAQAADPCIPAPATRLDGHRPCTPPTRLLAALP